MNTDRYAHASIRKPSASPIIPMRAPILQRKCACGGSAPGERCSECDERGQLQRRSSGARASAWRGVDGYAPAIVGEVLRSSGAPLDSTTRASMESRFGQDFGGVRVHTSERASASARAVDALAYTVGRDVVFGEGQYVPGSSGGLGLIAHELAHVAQQGAVRWAGGTLPIGSSDSRHEREADRAAAGTDAATQSSMGDATLRRQPAGGGGPEMPSEAGGLFLRVGENGRIEVLARPPALPGVGNVGAGFRCEGGRCQPVGSKDPSDVGNRTYTPQEALDLLRGEQPGPSMSGGNCPADRRVTGLGLCCPVGMSWDAQRSSCMPATPNLCLPAQMTPLGGCCPTGERWNFLHRRCEVAPSGSTFPPLPRLTVPPLTLRRPALRFGTIESSTFDGFVTDDATVPAQHSAALDHLASLLNIYRDVEVHIEGHTDSTASEAHNLRLSERRAQAIRQALADRNVTDPGRLKTEGFGEARLRVTPEGTDADRASNRRVEVWFYVPPIEGRGTQLRVNP